jgi:hypothetical protein
MMDLNTFYKPHRMVNSVLVCERNGCTQVITSHGLMACFWGEKFVKIYYEIIGGFLLAGKQVEVSMVKNNAVIAPHKRKPLKFVL